MADINTYALGLEFQLLAQPALESINQMVDAAKDLNNILVKASKAYKSEQTIYELDEIQKAQSTAALMTTAVAAAEVRYHKALKEGILESTLSAKAAEARNAKIAEMKDQLDATVESARDFFKENEKLSEFLKKDQKILDKRLVTTQKFEKSVLKETEAVKKQVQPVKDLAGWIGGLAKDTEGLGSVIQHIAGQYGLFGAALAFLGVGFKDIMNLQDAYRLASMRALGSQEALIKASNTLSMTLGATSKEAIETLQALAGVGFSTADSVNALADANFKFHKITGVGAATIARYQRTLGVMGMDAKQSTRILGDLSAVMRNTGLTTSQLEGLMSSLSKTMIELRLSFNPESVVKFAGALAQVSGAAHAAGVDGGALQSMLTDMASDVLGHAQAWNAFGVTISQNMDIADSTRTALKNMGPVVQSLTSQYGILTTTILEGRGIPKAAAAEIMAINEAAKKAGKTFDQYIESTKQGADINADFKAATATLTEQLKQLLIPIIKIASVIMNALVPAITSIISYITPIVTGIRDWWMELEKTHPQIAQVVSILLKGGVIIGTLTVGVAMLAGTFMKLGGSILGIIKPLFGASQAMTVAQQSSAGAGVGVRTFLMNLGAGLKALGNPEAMKGAITLGILTVAVAGTLLLVAYAMNKFGISGKDMILGATAMVIAAGAMVIMSFAIKSLSNAGPKAALAGAIIIGVLLALGAATLMAGFGIGFMAKGFAELFKAIPNIQTFLVVIGGLVLAMPLLALGIAFLGLSIIASAPFILAGFIILAAAAALAYFVIPAFSEFGKSLMVISQGVAAVGPNAGMALINLAIGITAFMAALMGIAAAGAVGGIGKLFGVKSPLSQAQEIASAMAVIAGPASMLGTSLDKLSKIDDVFKPFIASVLGRKEELAEAAAVIMALATQVDAARKAIGETTIANPFAPLTFNATPVRKPLITDDTARKVRDARNQSAMIESARVTNESLKEVVEKMDKNDAMKVLVGLLKEWLPKIASDDKESGGLASAANQWM
jgi:hypothetical protein